MNIEKLSNSRYLLHFLAVILPLLIFWTLYHGALDGWWKWDDFCDLEYENRQALGEPFLEKQTVAIYAPVHRFSRQIDFLLFGLSPTAFYWHQLISFTIALVFLYGILCLFFSPILASIIVSLVVVSEPTTEIVNFLMLRHYPEGLILALASILCYLLAVERQKFAWAMVGSLFYLLASSNIANYPLVAVLVFLPMGKLKTRIFMLTPFVGMAIFYVLLRAYMLGSQNLLAVSGHLAMPSALAILKFPAVFFSTTMGWQAFWQWLPLLVAIVGFSIALYKKPLSLGIASLAWFGATLVPLIPTLYRPDGLYYNHFNLVLLLYLGFGVAFKQLTELLPSAVLRHLLLGMLLIVSFFANLPAVHREQAFLQKIDIQSRTVEGFFLSANFPANATFIHGHHCGSGLVYVRKKILGQKTANWCPANDCACAALYPNSIGYQYDGKQWLTKPLSSCSVAKPLTASFKLTSATTLAWQLGPYTQGLYSFHLSNSDLFDFHWGQASAWAWFWPPALQGTYTSPRPIVEPVTITVRYVSPEGWEIFSPPLTLDPNGHLEVSWEN